MEEIEITSETQQLLEEHGLNWKVRKHPMITDLSNPSSPEEIDKDRVKMTKFQATVREDTEKVLGVVTDRYEPKQNGEILQLVNDAARQHKLEIVRAGSFKEGRRVFMQLKMPENYQVDNDELERYVFAMSSHDGSSSLAFGLSNNILSCMNQFNYFLRKSRFTVRHTRSIHSQATLLQQKIEHILFQQENLYSVFHKFAGKEADTKFIEATINKALRLDKYLDKNEEFSTRKENQILELKESIESEIEEKGSTVWGVFNGITHYANHKKSFPNRENGRTESILTGGAHKLMNRSFSHMTKELGMKINLN